MSSIDMRRLFQAVKDHAVSNLIVLVPLMLVFSILFLSYLYLLARFYQRNGHSSEL